ncbi:hypothetical protein K449DRAFT_213173 [Hypoxylon sp. EC38]|nr:hypothetical protein K449DRAFT_213173 [Hypoxylon sp. EC38]
MASEDINNGDTVAAASEPTRNDGLSAPIEAGHEPSISSCDSTNGIMTPAVTEAEAVEALELPPWFLKSCVKTLEELTALDVPLKVYDSSSAKDNSSNSKSEDSAHYAVRDVLYESLFDLVSPLGQSEDHQEHIGATHPRKFVHDAMALRMPHQSQGQRFLELVVQHFAGDIGADILSLSLHDFEDLATHFASLSGRTLPDGISASRDLYFLEPETPTEEPNTEEGNEETPASDDDKSKSIEKESDQPQEPEARKKLLFPFERLFASVSEKRNSSQANFQGQNDRPIIILLHEVADNFYQAPRSILTHLRDAVKDARCQGREIAIIALDNQNDSVYGYNWPLASVDDEFLSDLGSNPVKAVQVIVPMKSAAQKRLLEKDEIKATQRNNIRKLQRKIREGLAVHSFSGLLEPHVDWELSEDSFAAKRLNDPNFSDRELELAASALSRNMNFENVERVFERLRILNEWIVDDEEEKKTPGRWDKFHESAQKALQEIENDCNKYKYENDLLDCIVASGKFSSSDVNSLTDN